MLDMQWVRKQMNNASSKRQSPVDEAGAKNMKTVNLPKPAWVATGIVLGALLAIRIVSGFVEKYPGTIMKETYATEFYD